MPLRQYPVPVLRIGSISLPAPSSPHTGNKSPATSAAQMAPTGRNAEHQAGANHRVYTMNTTTVPLHRQLLLRSWARRIERIDRVSSRQLDLLDFLVHSKHRIEALITVSILYFYMMRKSDTRMPQGLWWVYFPDREYVTAASA